MRSALDPALTPTGLSIRGAMKRVCTARAMSPSDSFFYVVSGITEKYVVQRVCFRTPVLIIDVHTLSGYLTAGDLC